MNNAKKVEIRNLTKRFVAEKKELLAVNDINLIIEPGDFICLLGPSGCGKTTLLRMIAGFEIPTSGDIFIGGKNVDNLTPNKRDTAMVFQNYALFPHMNVYDNIAYGLKVKRKPKSEIDERVKNILELMKMDEFTTRVPSEMSGGQQQRISLARALIMNSGVLLFDEPLSNLDAKLRVHMRDEIRKIQQEVGITSIYVTHDQSEAMALSDKVVIMKDGKIMQVGSPIEIYQKPNSAFIAKFIGRAGIFKAKVLNKENEMTKIELFGSEYNVPEKVKAQKGDEVEVITRPETIKFENTKHTGKVIKSVFMGENHEYEIELDGKIIEISLNNPSGEEIKKIGENINFSFAEKAIHIL